MARLTKVEKHHLMEVLSGDDEVKLVRKKLNWNYEPFEIPKKLLNEWRKIGIKAHKK